MTPENFHGWVNIIGRQLRFFRRSNVDEKNNISLEELKKRTLVNSFSWDEPTHEMYYRCPDKKLYKVNFELLDGE